MTETPVAQTAEPPASPRRPLLRWGLALACLALAAVVFARGPVVIDQWPGLPAWSALAAAGSLVALALLALVLPRGVTSGSDARPPPEVAVYTHDLAPVLVTDDAGLIIACNPAAAERFATEPGQPLAAAISGAIAAPGAVIHRLGRKARIDGAAREDVVLRRGRMRLQVHRLGEDGPLVWRAEDIGGGAGAGRGSDAVSLPMMTVGKSGAILHMNEALRRLIGGRETALEEVITDLPLRPGGMHTVAGLDGPVRVRLIELGQTTGRRELYLAPAEDDEAAADWSAYDHLPVPMVQIDAGGVIAGANRRARELLDDPLRPGTPLSHLVEGLGRPIGDWLADAARGRGLGRPEIVRATRPSEDRYLQITLGRMLDGEAAALVAVLNDATELKTLEAQFVQSQKMQAIGQLAGGVAHDFNNLLTAISGHCDLLLLRHDEGDPDYSDLIQINQNANRAASLVGQLLAFSRKQTLRPELLDLRDTLGEMTHLLNRLVGEKVTLQLSHDPGLRMVRADKRQLEQVLMNLVVNARDAMPEGGRVEITTENRTLTEPLKRDRADVPAGDYVVVRVTDEGMGIPPDKLQKIFEPFYTTKRTGEGTGLGLSTAYGIVKQTGGYIFADSAPGTGTAFTLFFPAHDAEERPEPVPEALPPARPARQGQGVVLLVEDEAPVRAFASRALRMRGYTVLEAENAEEALKTLEDESLDVDVFVTDVIMPGMDGPSWVKQALRARPGTRVVFVSGYAEMNFGEERAEIPNAVFLPKPFSLSQLTTTVQNQIH